MNVATCIIYTLYYRFVLNLRKMEEKQTDRTTGHLVSAITALDHPTVLNILHNFTNLSDKVLQLKVIGNT